MLPHAKRTQSASASDQNLTADIDRQRPICRYDPPWCRHSGALACWLASDGFAEWPIVEALDIGKVDNNVF